MKKVHIFLLFCLLLILSCENPVPTVEYLSPFPFSESDVSLTFNQDTGSYIEPITVEISSSTPCDIFYALEGTSNSGAEMIYQKYTVPVNIGESCVLHAYAQRGLGQTVVYSKEYDISQVGTPMSYPQESVFGFPFSLTLSSLTPESEIRYTIDGTAPDESSTLYTGTIEVFKSLTVRAKAYRNGMSPSDEFSQSYTINLDSRISSLELTDLPIMEQVGIPGVLASKDNWLYSAISSRGIEVFNTQNGQLNKMGMVLQNYFIADTLITDDYLIVCANSSYDSYLGKTPRYLVLFSLSDKSSPTELAKIELNYQPYGIEVVDGTITLIELGTANIHRYSIPSLFDEGTITLTQTTGAVVNDLKVINGILYGAVEIPSPNELESGLYTALATDFSFSKETFYERNLETAVLAHTTTPSSIIEMEDFILLFSDDESKAYFYFWNEDNSKLLYKYEENMSDFVFDSQTDRLYFNSYYRDYTVSQGDDLKDIFPIMSANNTYPQGVTYTGRFTNTGSCIVTSYINGTGFQLQTISDENLSPLYQKWYPSDNPYGVISNNGYLYYASEESTLRILSAEDYSTVYSFHDESMRSMDNFAFSDDLMVITTFDGGTITLYDNSNPASPSKLSRIYLPPSFDNVWNPRIVGDKLFLCHGYMEPASISVYDISDRENPLFLTTLLSNKNLWSPVIRDNLLYFTYENGGLYIYDITDIYNPVLLNSDTLSSTLNDGGNTNRPFGFTMDYPYLYLNNGGYGIRVIDVSDPVSPNIVSTLPGRTTSNYLVDNYLFALGGAGTIEFGTGLRVFDISTRDNPQFIKEITSDSGVKVTDMTLAFADGKIIGSDYSVGLIVFE